jgi:formylglycine-generating enzyme
VPQEHDPWIVTNAGRVPTAAAVLALALSACSSESNASLDQTPTRICIPGEQRACACLGGWQGVQICNDTGSKLEACTGCPDAGGAWEAGGAVCNAGGSGGNGGTADAASSSNPSCSFGLTCNGESCCATITVPGGAFPQGRSDVGLDQCPGTMACYPDEQPEHVSTVSTFALDKYEVTVGRFRAFVNAYLSNGVDGGTASAPAEGAGTNPNVPVATGASNNATGWQSAWNALLPATQGEFIADLKCNAASQTWTDAVGANEQLPINCVTWHEAFAFCIWDGGRLPTESEWEYAAAGGLENRLYPWGLAAPSCALANFNNGVTYCGPGGPAAAATVGSYPKGNGRWGHADLAGNVLEWVFDLHGSYTGSAETDYANVSDGYYRVHRGGFSLGLATQLRAAYRFDANPSPRSYATGLRCARSVP